MHREGAFDGRPQEVPENSKVSEEPADLRRLYRRARVNQHMESIMCFRSIAKRAAAAEVRHRRIMTEITRPTPPKIKNQMFGVGREEDQRVHQIVEALDSPEREEELKAGDHVRRSRKQYEKARKQIAEAVEIQFARTTLDNVSSHEDSDPLDIGVYDQELEDNETELEVTVGTVGADAVILVTRDSFLILWPRDMLPTDVKAGNRFSMMVKRNTNSEALRENSIWTFQNQVISQLGAGTPAEKGVAAAAFGRLSSVE